MVSRIATRGEDTGTRLAVIEEKLEMVLAELAAIRAYIPGKMVEHSERIASLERNLRSLQWFGAMIALAFIGTFIGHILSG